MEELNLYDDLDEFQEQQEKKSKELQELENKYQESLKTIEDLQAENKKLKKNIKTIELNFQSLLDTARAEIRRKNKEIDQLRKEKDDICFRRRVPHKVESHKRHLVADAELPENSTQTHRNKEINDPESKETFTPQGNQTHDDKAENISKPGRDESFKRNRSQERDQTNDNKRLKNIRDDKDYKSSHERHKDRYADAYKNSRQSDERNHNSHDRRKYESAERIHKTKSPERHRGAPNKSQSRSRERYRRDNSPEREKKTGHWESRESLERHRRPHNRSHSREAYKKHDKSELNKKIDHSNFSESSNSDKRQFYNSHNSERYNFENRDRKEVNKYTNSTLKGPIGPEVLNSVNDKLKQGNKADNEGETKGGISDTAQNVSNQIVTPENIDEETAKVCKDMTVDLTENDNLHSTNRGEKYEEQPFKHKKRNSDLKKIAISINSCVKGNKDDQNANTKQVQISSEEDKTNNSDDLTTTTSKQSGAKQSSNENPFDKPSESDKQQEPLLTVEASKLGTPCKVALFNEIFGQSSSTTTTSSSTKSLFNNIKGILANFTPNEGITTPTTSPGDCTEASDCIGTTKTKVCRDNVRENEMDKSLMPEESKSSDTTDKDLTKVMEEGIANEIHSVQIPGLDLCGESVITKHELKTTDTFNNESLTGLFTKQHLNDSEEQRIVQESKERESDMQNVSENSLQMPNKLNLKDAEQQKEANESKQMQSKAHLLLDNVLEVEDINRNVKQQISLQKSSKQSVKDKEEQNELKSHLVADNVTKENIQSYTKNHEQTSLDDISKNVKQTLPDNEQPKDKSMDIQIESNVRLVENKSPEFVKDKTPLEDTNKQNLKDKRKPKGESEDIHIERKSITNLEAVKDKTYLKDVDKSKQNNTLQEPTKQNQKVEEDYKRGNKSIQIETNCHLMHEFVKDKINVEVINQNTKCIDKEKLPKLETTSLIDSQNENVTENEQQIGKAQKAVESIEGEENTKQSGLLYTKSEFEKAVPQLNEIQVNISDNRNDDLIAANEYNTLTNSKVFPENSSKLMTTQENKVATIISPIAQDKINAAEIKNSDTMSKNESPNKDCLLEENKNENLCDKQQNSAKCTDLLTILDHETSISANISREITNNEYCKIQNRVEFTKSNDDEYSLENLESPELDRTEIANSIDISNPINCKSINTPLEIQNFSDEITRSSNASDKHKDTDNDSNRTQIQEAHISESASQDIKRNESLEILNRRESTRPAEEEYSFENQNFCNEITESANAGDKPNDKDTDSDKIQVQDVDLKDNESIEVLSAIEGSNKATGEQDPHENQNSFEEITSNAATSDKTNDANNDLFKSQVQETFIFESIPLVSEKTTSSASSENVSDKTEVRKADISGSALQEVENNESIDTNRAEIAKAEVADGQYPVENQDFSEEIIKTVTISDEPNDTSNNSNETQSQKVPSQDIESNASIGTNRVEVAKPPDEQCPLETQDYSEEITKTAATSGEPIDTDHDSDRTPFKEHAEITSEGISQNVNSNENMETLNRVKITKATDQETLVENQKMLSESANKNASEDDKNGTENTSHNDASLVLGKHVSPSLETLKSDQISATVTCLRETSLPTVKLNDLNSESYHLEVAAAEQAVKGSDGVKKLKSAGLESLGLEPKLLCESSERIVPETTTKKKSTFLTDNNDRITVNEQQTKAQCEGAPLMSSVASEKGKEVLGNGDNVRDFKAGDALMNVKVTESKAQDSRPTTISDSHTRSIDCSTDENVKQNSAVDFTDQIQNQMSGVIQKQTSKDSEEELLNSPEKFQHGLENAKGNETHSTGAEIKLPQSCAEKDDRAKTIACHTFNKSCKIKSNSNHEKALMPNTPDQIQNKTANIEVAKQIEVTKKNISNSDKASGIVGEITRNENETINKQKSPGNIKSYPNPEILKVECSTLKRLQQEHDFQKISPALPDSFNTSPTLPSISTSSPTPSNFSGIFSKKSSHLSNAEEDFHKLKKKSLHFSTRPREFIIPAASVLCNVDNLENATKLNKKLHWELLDNRNELTEIEDDTDIEMTDEERHKLKGEIKQEQVSPRESPQQSPKNVQDEQSNPQEINCGTQTMPPKIHKSKQYKYKLSKTIKSNPKSMKVNKLDSVIHSSVIEQKPFTIVLPKRQRGRPRKLENLLKATIKAKTGPRILKKRGRKPKKRIEFTESFDNNSMECAEPSNDKIADAVISDGECASNVKQNDELLLEETPTEIRRTCGTILHQEEDKSRQSSSELNDKNNQQRSSEDNYTRNPECFTKNQVISMEPETKVVEASTNKDCDDAGKSRQITARADQNSNPESKKISKESYTEMSVNKPVTLSLNSGNNCDDVSTTSGDSENKLLIISDGGQEELNEKQTEKELSSTKSKPPERRKSASTKKDKKYISLEDIGIKVRPFKGHLSTLRIPKVNKDADQTNAWKLETYEEFDKQQLEEKVEQKIESEMNGSTKTVKVANKDFLSTYRIPKIKRDTGLGKDNLETSDNTPKGEKHEKIKESYPFESKDKLNNNCNATEAKSLDKTKHTWRPDNAGLKEKSEKSYKTPRQQKDDECGNAGSKTETSKRKLFNLETYNDDVDHEDKLGNVEVNKQIKACAEKKLSDSKLSEKESPCCTAKPVKLRRKSLNMPRKMLLTSSDEEEAKHLENVDAKNPLERNALYTRKKASLHRRILDSSCDEEVEVLDSKIKEKSTNKPNIPLKQRRKSMFVESTTDFHHSDERLSDKRLTSKDLVKSTSCSETFDSENNADMLSSSENIKFLKTTVETTDSKDTGPKKSLKIRRKSLFVESTCSKTPSLDDTKTTDVMQNDNTAHVKPRKDDDNIVGSSIKNKNDNTELKRTRLSKPRRKSMYVETDFASDLKDNFEGVNKTKEMLTNPMEKILKMGRTSTDVKTTSVNETSKKEISTDEPVDRKDDVEMERKSTIRDLTEERNNSHEPIDKEIDVEPILKQNNKEDPVNTNEITNDLDSCPLKPRRKSINHRRILDSSSDDNEPLMKKPLLIVNEIKPPAAPTEPKTKVRKRRIVKVLSTSRDSINTSANSSLQSENLTQIHSNSPSPFASPLHNHPIFNREVSIQSREFVASMPVTPNQQDDDKKFKEIDSKLHQIFQSPQYATEYKTNHNTTADSNIMEMLSTSLPTGNQGKSITSETALDHNQENDQSSANVVINKPGPSPHTTTVDSNKLDMLSASLTDSQGMDVIPREAQPDINQENNQSSTNITQINESNATLNNTTAASPNCSEIKHLSLGSAEYRFEKVSENVVNLFISRKRKRKRHN